MRLHEVAWRLKEGTNKFRKVNKGPKEVMLKLMEVIWRLWKVIMGLREDT